MLLHQALSSDAETETGPLSLIASLVFIFLRIQSSAKWEPKCRREKRKWKKVHGERKKHFLDRGKGYEKKKGKKWTEK